MIAAFLVRCSTNKGDYDRQIKDLKRVANEYNFKVSEKYIFGEYITGKDDTTISDRKSIRLLNESAKKKEIDVILVNEVSRMSRDSVSGRVYVRQFNNWDIPVYFRDRGKWTIDLNTRIVDTAFEKELGMFFDGAAEYLKSLKTQTASGRRKRLEDNQMVQGKPAYGYTKLGGKDKYTRNTVIVDPVTSEIVVDTFQKYLEEGATLKSTALAISAKYNINFSVGKINHILNYSGYYTGQTTVNVKDPDRDIIEPYIITFDKLIDEVTFKKTREKLSNNRSYKKPHSTKITTRLLTRLIKCSYCEHSFSPRRRNDKRTAATWLCMSRINNSSECESHINLNDEIVSHLIWNLIKTELIIYSDINKEQRETRITEAQETISRNQEEIIDLDSNITNQKKVQTRAYNAYINAPDGLEETALEQYNKTLIDTKKEIEYLENRKQILSRNILDAEDKITRYSQTDYSESYIKEIENDFNKKRNLVLEYIKAIYPYKVDYRIVILEVHTVEGIYNILLNGNQRKNKEAQYIHGGIAMWQSSNNRHKAYNKGDYFLITQPDLVMDSDELEEMATYDEMIELCRASNWIMKY